MTLDRRDFLAVSAGGLAAAPLARAAPPRSAKPFALDYAPHFGMFQHTAGADLSDQIAFMADQGFRSLEDNWMGNRPAEEQAGIAAAMEKHGLRMGVFVAHGEFAKPSFASNDPAQRDRILADVAKAVEVAKRVRAKWCTVVPGTWDLRRDRSYQIADAIDNLRRAAEVCEKGGLVMVLEALNPGDHPNAFPDTIGLAYLLCRAVGSPSCKLIFDLYHQQITDGHLLRHLDQTWEEIGYVQTGDNPGRAEPGTGEVNYANVFRHLHRKGYQGILGMEHGNSRPGKDGEAAVIAAYRAVDPT
jgi:hydroxypyruvate isomerase